MAIAQLSTLPGGWPFPENVGGAALGQKKTMGAGLKAAAGPGREKPCRVISHRGARRTFAPGHPSKHQPRHHGSAYHFFVSVGGSVVARPNTIFPSQSFTNNGGRWSSIPRGGEGGEGGGGTTRELREKAKNAPEGRSRISCALPFLSRRVKCLARRNNENPKGPNSTQNAAHQLESVHFSRKKERNAVRPCFSIVTGGRRIPGHPFESRDPEPQP